MHATAPRILSTLSSLVLIGATVLTAAPAQAGDWFGSKTVAATGRTSSVNRELAPFHHIAVNLQGKIELIQGNTEGAVVEGDENHLPLVETTVTNGKLNIRLAKGVALPSNAKIKVTVHVRNVDSLSLSGSGDLSAARLSAPKLASSIAGSGTITITDLQSDDLKVSISGSGSFEAQGAAKAMAVSIAGSGDVSTSKLSVQEVKVSIAGSGDAILWVRQALSVSIAGSGDVRYYGEGTLRNASTMGAGSVKQLGNAPPV